MPRCRRILLLRHVRRAWGRKRSLLLLISVAAGADSRPWLRARENKRPPETSAVTARDYSTTFRADCKDSGYGWCVIPLRAAQPPRSPQNGALARGGFRTSRCIQSIAAVTGRFLEQGTGSCDLAR